MPNGPLSHLNGRIGGKLFKYYVYEILARRRDQTTNNCNLMRSHNSFTFSSKLVLESYTDRVKKGALSNNEKIWNFNACFNFAFNMCVFLNVGDGVARRNHVISSPICPQAEGVYQDFAVNGNIPKKHVFIFTCNGIQVFLFRHKITLRVKGWKIFRPQSGSKVAIP